MKSFRVVVVLLALTACGKSDKQAEPAKADKAAPAGKTGEPAAGADGACLPGKYTRDENGTKQVIVFRPDGTGEEVGDGGKPNQPFTWKAINANTVKITYPTTEDTVGGEFEHPYNCAQKTYAVLFKKE